VDFGLKGKVAAVAAGTKGIGLACATGLLAEGCRVAVCSRSGSDDLPDGIRPYRADVAQVADLQAWVSAVGRDLGPIDVLVTNTGGPPAGPWMEMTDDQWRAGLDSTLLSVVRLVRLVGPGMAQRGWGRIVHVTSLVAKEPSPLLPISSTIRSGLSSLTRLQAQELAPHGVTVNAVLPGHTRTDRQVHLAEVRAAKECVSLEEALRRQAASVPMGRLAEPEEIAAAVVFLCSERASYVTGTNLLVDGGAVRGVA
jgi:3-oxoacyl-[acyl-carrier protein] reductase